MVLHTELTIGRYFEKQVAADPDRDFVLYPDRDLKWTYAQFDERVSRLSKGLLAIGIGKGDHVGIWARNVPDWLTFMFATAKIGAVLVTVNPVYKSHELAYVIKQSDMKALVIIDTFRDVDYVEIIRGLVPEASTQERGHLDSPEFPMLKSLIYMGPEKHRGFYNVPELLVLGEHMPDAPLHELTASLHADDVVNMQYTSGTTGFPKGVMLTSRNILNNGFFIGERQDLTPADRVCLPVPLFHCFGCVLGVLATLTHGATLVMVESFDPVLVLAAVQKSKATALYGVPTMFITELAAPEFEKTNFSTLRTGIMAGSPCPVDTMKRVQSDMHISEMTICYGMTETSPVSTQTRLDDPLEKRVTTVGPVHPHVEVKIIDPETRRTIRRGETGELCTRGYCVMLGYWEDEEATRDVIDAARWMHTGDLATMDDDGYLNIVGRIKDMIICGGENIYPREIEEFLYSHPQVVDVQVIGIPDPKFGEAICAWIIPRQGSELDAKAIKDFCRDQIARYKIPRYFRFVDSFPMTISGKVQKYKMRETEIEERGLTEVETA